MDMKALESLIDTLAPSRNHFCAFRVKGNFPRVKTRSVPRQNKPYPPLVDVAKHQPVFQLSDLEGTLVGFRSPAFVKGVNVPGYHIHFISHDVSSGGHVLDFEISQGEVWIDSLNDWLHVYLPPQGARFDDVDLNQDRTNDVKAVEKERKPGSGADRSIPPQRFFLIDIIFFSL